MTNIVIKIQQQFGEALFTFIKNRVKSEEAAKDLYQEVILKILHKYDHLNNQTSLKSWLFTIARNQVVDYHRERKHHAGFTALEEDLYDETIPDSYQELKACLSGFIAQLPDDYREIITLSEIEGMSQKELARQLGLNYVTVRSKVQRGRERIRKMILDVCIIEQDNSGRVISCTHKLDKPGYGGLGCSIEC